MNIVVNRESSTPIYLQIRNSIRQMILDGVLKEGFKLPPERKLAQILGVNRSTVLNAYRELKADGIVESHIGKGTIVCKNHTPDKEGAVKAHIPWRQLFSETMSRSRDTLVRDILELANRKDVISFAAGVAVPGLDSLENLKEIQNEIIKDYGHNAVQYAPTEGYGFFRESICGLLRTRKIHVQPDEIMVLSGSQQGIDFAARVFLDPGDIVVVEEPTFFCALQIFKSAGARIISVPVDDSGIRTDMLETLLERYRPKFIYTIPTFQNPSGITMTLERRKQVLEMAYRYQVLILEDDPYGELRYEDCFVPPLKALDSFGYVIYLSTFSKLLYPGLRVGWVAAPRQVIHEFTVAKQMADLHCSSLSQLITDKCLRKGLLSKHIKRLKEEGCIRRDMMLESLEKNAVPGVSWNKPEGGLYIWCSLPEGINKSTLMAKAVEKKVAFVPGNVFSQSGQFTNYIRLNFTFPSCEQIREGIKRLMKAVSETLEEGENNSLSVKADIKPII